MWFLFFRIRQWSSSGLWNFNFWRSYLNSNEEVTSNILWLDFPKKTRIFYQKLLELPLKDFSSSTNLIGLESYLLSTLFDRSSILDFQSPNEASGNPLLKKFWLKLDQRFLDCGQALLIGNGDIPWLFDPDLSLFWLFLCFVGSEIVITYLKEMASFIWGY